MCYILLGQKISSYHNSKVVVECLTATGSREKTFIIPCGSETVTKFLMRTSLPNPGALPLTAQNLEAEVTPPNSCPSCKQVYTPESIFLWKGPQDHHQY